MFKFQISNSINEITEKKQAGYIIQTIIIKYKLLNIKEKVLLQLFSIMIYLFYFYFILFLFL